MSLCGDGGFAVRKESAQEPLGSAREERQSLKFSLVFSPNARKNRNATCSFHLEPEDWWSFSAPDWYNDRKQKLKREDEP